MSAARAGEPGHPLYVPSGQRAGRIDNPDLYRVLYAADDPAGAFAEAFGNKSRWTDAMFASNRLPDSRRSMIEIEATGPILDLDDAKMLVARDLRPSSVATPERSVTRRWASEAFAAGRWDGVRWWSVRDARWKIYGFWAARLRVVAMTPLTRDHPAAMKAAEMLARRW